MKYLVTGGTGFIGSALVRRLVEEGHQVRVLDNDLRGAERRLRDMAGKIESVKADIRDADKVQKAVEGVDSVFHLAYVNGTEFFYSKPDLVLDIAVKGMANIIDACRDTGVKELFLASSSEVYQTPEKIPTDESAPLIVPDPLNPRYSYGGGKIICELMALNFGRKYFDRVVIFRPHNVYGPDMGYEHVIPQFTLRLKELADNSTGGIDFPIQGTGQETRAFVYISDFIDGLVCLLHKGEHLNIYHIGTMEEITIESLAREIARSFSRDIRLVPGELRAGGTMRRCPDIRKIKGLGYQPKVSLSAGVRKTADWYIQNAKTYISEKLK